MIIGPLLHGDSFLEKDLRHHQHILKRIPVNVGSLKSGASVGKYGTSSLAPKTSEQSRFPPLESPGCAEMTKGQGSSSVVL